MAVRAAIIDQGKSASKGDFSIQRVQWNGLLNGDTGTPIGLAEWADWTLQVGTTNIQTGAASVPGAGLVVSLQGSNDYQPTATDDGYPANAGTWSPIGALIGPTGAASLATQSTTLPAFMASSERPLWVRPAVTAGDGTTTVNVVGVFRRVQPMMRGG